MLDFKLKFLKMILKEYKEKIQMKYGPGCRRKWVKQFSAGGSL
jgi:hypothetical protein